MKEGSSLQEWEREGGTFTAGKAMGKSCIHGETFMLFNWFRPLDTAGSHTPHPMHSPALDPKPLNITN